MTILGAILGLTRGLLRRLLMDFLNLGIFRGYLGDIYRVK